MTRLALSAAVLSAAVLAAASATPALASDACKVPQSQWQPKHALQKKLEAQGWKIRQIKTDDGCYEVYAMNSKGQRMETYFNPKTFARVKSESDD